MTSININITLLVLLSLTIIASIVIYENIVIYIHNKHIEDLSYKRDMEQLKEDCLRSGLWSNC